MGRLKYTRVFVVKFSLPAKICSLAMLAGSSVLYYTEYLETGKKFLSMTVQRDVL